MKIDGIQTNDLSDYTPMMLITRLHWLSNAYMA